MRNYILTSIGLAAFFSAGLIHSDEMQDSTSCGKGPRPSRLAFRHIEANGIGYNQGYSTVEGFFAPSEHYNDCWLPFLDLRGHVFNNGQPAINAGLGLRYLTDSRVYGINAYYDYRKTHKRPYNQIGVGLETLGEIWDFRINGYFPVGKNKTGIYDAEFSHFSEYSMIISAKEQFALTGFNAEVGAHVNNFEHFPIYFAAGTYYLNRDGVNAWGGQFRAAVDIYDYLRLEGNTSYDSIYKWVGQGQLSLIVPLGQKNRVSAKSDQTCRQAELMATRAVQKVDRFEIIATHHKHFHEVATYPNGTPITFIFVNNTNGSDGSFEDPFADLTDAFDVAEETDIIYVFPGDGTSTGLEMPYGGFDMLDDMQLLGAGVDHNIDTQFGIIVVGAQAEGYPYTTINGTALNLANRNTVSGIKFVTTLSCTGQDTIYGEDIEDVTISDNIFFGQSDTTGIHLVETYGEINVSRNELIGAGGSGFYLDNDSVGLATVNFIANTVQGHYNGFYVDAYSGTQVDALVEDNSIGTLYESVYLYAEGPTTFVKSVIKDNALEMNYESQNGVITVDSNESVFDVEIAYNSLFHPYDDGVYMKQYNNGVSDDASSLKIHHNEMNVSGDGIYADVSDYGQVTIDILGNNINAENHGIHLISDDDSYVLSTIDGARISSEDYAIYLDIEEQGELSATITRNEIFSDEVAIYLDIEEQGVLSATITQNEIATSSNGLGVDIDDFSTLNIIFDDNRIAAGSNGISIGADDNTEVSLTLNRNEISATNYGLEVYAYNSTIDITLEDNMVQSSDSFIYLDSESDADVSLAVNRNAISTLEYGLQWYGYGDSTLNVTFDENLVESGHAFIYCNQYDSSFVTLSANNNTISSMEYAVEIYNYSDVDDSIVTFNDNYVRASKAGDLGGGLYPAIYIEKSDSSADFYVNIQNNEIYSSLEGIQVEAYSGFICADISDNLITSLYAPIILETDGGDMNVSVIGNTIESIAPVEATVTSETLCLRMQDNFMRAEAEFYNNGGTFNLEPYSGNTPADYDDNGDTITEVGDGDCDCGLVP